MLPRRVEARVRDRLERHNCVVLAGSRGCGKSTLAKAIATRTFDLEDEPDRDRVAAEWDEIATSSGIVALEEPTGCPELVDRLVETLGQQATTARPRFLVTASAFGAREAERWQRCRDRVAIVSMTPLLLTELVTSASIDRHWLCGGLPVGGTLRPRRHPDRADAWVRDRTLRDLPDWGLPSKPRVTQRLLRMLAATHRSAWNASRFAKALDVSYPTVNGWVDHLERAFLVRRLPAWRGEIGKRLVKSPKVYVRDSGVLHALLRIDDSKALREHPWVAASYEGYALEQILGELDARGPAYEATYFRTSDGYEIELVLDFADERWAVGIRHKPAPRLADVHRLEKSADLVDADRRFLVTGTPYDVGSDTRVLTDLTSLLKRLPTE